MIKLSKYSLYFLAVILIIVYTKVEQKYTSRVGNAALRKYNLLNENSSAQGGLWITEHEDSWDPYNNTTTEVGCLQELDKLTFHIFS